MLLVALHMYIRHKLEVKQHKAMSFTKPSKC